MRHHATPILSPDRGQQFQYVEQSWTEESACSTVTDTPGDLFFNAISTREAKAICARCPVAWDCLKYAASKVIIHGVWGGMDETERKQFLNENRWVLDRKAHTRFMNRQRTTR